MCRFIGVVLNNDKLAGDFVQMAMIPDFMVVFGVSNNAR